MKIKATNNALLPVLKPTHILAPKIIKKIIFFSKNLFYIAKEIKQVPVWGQKTKLTD